MRRVLITREENEVQVQVIGSERKYSLPMELVETFFSIGSGWEGQTLVAEVNPLECRVYTSPYVEKSTETGEYHLKINEESFYIRNENEVPILSDSLVAYLNTFQIPMLRLGFEEYTVDPEWIQENLVES